MGMTRKTVLYVLAVVVLTGAMAVAALADYNWERGAYSPDSSVTAKPEQVMEPSAAGVIREPVETGALPNSSGSSFKQDTGEEPKVEIGGQMFRPSIDLGP
jgi:hypothetical protein